MIFINVKVHKIEGWLHIFFNLQVEVEVLQIESDDVVNAIADEVSRCNIKRLVIGASSRGIFSRYELIMCLKLRLNFPVHLLGGEACFIYALAYFCMLKGIN